MARSTKEAWLQGPGDLAEEEVADVPVPGASVKIRALSATAANAAMTEAVSTTNVRGQQAMRVDSVKLDILRFSHGVVEPAFSTEEATVVSARFGPAFNRVVAKIVEISGLSEEAITATQARFPSGGSGEAGKNGDAAPGGSERPLQPARARAETGDDS